MNTGSIEQQQFYNLFSNDNDIDVHLVKPDNTFLIKHNTIQSLHKNLIHLRSDFGKERSERYYNTR